MTASTRSRAWGRRSIAFVAALAIAVVWGSLAQTQFNLQALVAFVDIPPGVRLRTSWQDLLGFGPVYAGLVLAAWLPAFLAASVVARYAPRLRTGTYALAAGAGLAVAIRVADAVAPMPVLIDATRTTVGLLVLALGSAVGGALFAHWTRASAKGRIGSHDGAA
ncbi:hypothetical protein [Luteimonas abyssi]|uniref:hypothetical protein n=1 Tax=Luteimonas abyssi TaxID=1247514 RepID=UPI000737CAFF|nr:hypothetical protein [Luteimonas abyssi]